MIDDSELLRRYAAEKSDAAFAELVQRHLGLVYHTALRHLHGHAAGAEDVAQVVFADLAQRAGSLTRHPLLAGWLHTRTRYAALNHLRAERRRRARDQAALLMDELTRESEPAADWTRLQPVIDAALEALRPIDREAILLRFFEGLGFAELGARLQLTEDGARARVDRALEKMARLLARRGVTSTAGALSVALASHAASVTPTGLAASVTGAVLSGAAVVSTSAAFTWGALSLMKVTTALLTGSLAANVILTAAYVRDADPPRPVLGGSPATSISAPASPTAVLKAAYHSDPTIFQARLRATAIPDHIRRALIEAAIDDQFRAREEALAPPRADLGWWQWRDKRVPMETSLALLDLRREKAKLREQLLGPDPAALAAADADNPIPAAKRAQLTLITEDYAAMLASLRFEGPLLPAESKQLQLVEAQRKKDLAALLTPEELAAYEERTWSELDWMRENLRYADATAAEFRLLKASMEREEAELKSDGLTIPEQERELHLLHAAVGQARFDDIHRSRHMEFRQLQALLERNGRPLADAVPVYAIWQNIEAETQRIRQDDSLSPAEKTEAVQQFAQRTRSGIEAALGPEVATAFLKNAYWMRALERGDGVRISVNGYSTYAINAVGLRSPHGNSPDRSRPLP